MYNYAKLENIVNLAKYNFLCRKQEDGQPGRKGEQLSESHRKKTKK